MMPKNKLFLILSGCAVSVVGILYLHFFGFENSRFRVDVPNWSGPIHRKPIKVFEAEVMNVFLSLIDWIILIGIVIIVTLIVFKVAKALFVSLFQRKKSTSKIDTSPESTEQ